MKAMLTKAMNRGVVCERCQEGVNIHCCAKCKEQFGHYDAIYCVENGRSIDNSHYHKECYKEIEVTTMYGVKPKKTFVQAWWCPKCKSRQETRRKNISRGKIIQTYCDSCKTTSYVEVIR